jgi:hypothetical protein
LGLVQGDDLEMAEYRFFTEMGLAPVDEPPPAPRSVLSSRWKAEQPDFIFPGFGRS